VEPVGGLYGEVDATAYASSNQKLPKPQAIGHRGYKAKYPENTMSSFTAAVEAGVEALETDVRLSKDDVVVLSHVRLFVLNRF